MSGFRGTNVTGIEISFYGVSLNGYRSTIVSLIDVFEQILDGMNRNTNFNVYMTLVFQEEIRVVRNNPPVIKRFAVLNEDASRPSSRRR